jgi:hypothetical protein
MISTQARPYARRFAQVRRGGTAPLAIPGAVIPYDYAASFQLKGIPGNIVQDVINVSSDGVFVATGIGYGLQEERVRSLAVSVENSLTANGIKLGQIPVEALITGFRLSPRFGPMVALDQELAPQFGASILERLKPPEDISFLFSLVDSASGRELQDEPTHNLASLGKSNGERPFRQLAQPLTFMPRSSVRLHIVERSEGVKGNLFIVLYGYKLLGASNCPEPLLRRLQGSPMCRIETIGQPSQRVVPFDYVARLELSGRAENLIETEVPINAEGGFVTTAIGYGLETGAAEIPITVPDNIVSPPSDSTAEKTFQLSQLPLGALPQDALLGGIRIRPSILRIAFDSGGGLSDKVRASVAGKIFENLNRAEDVSFLYSIYDAGAGRDLQNQPIHNIAGLGIANGDRPFKKLARAMIFKPRSAIRVSVQEHFGRGMLYFVFQGFKVLGISSQGARR